MEEYSVVHEEHSDKMVIPIDKLDAVTEKLNEEKKDKNRFGNLIYVGPSIENVAKNLMRLNKEVNIIIPHPKEPNVSYKIETILSPIATVIYKLGNKEITLGTVSENQTVIYGGYKEFEKAIDYIEACKREYLDANSEKTNDAELKCKNNENNEFEDRFS